MILKKLWLFPSVLVLVACGMGAVPKTAESTVSITAPDGYAVACATDFTRLQPHFCRANFTGIDAATLSFGVGCQTQALPSVPESAVAVQLLVSNVMTANNTLSSKTHNLTLYDDPSCTNALVNLHQELREQILTVSGTILQVTTTIVPFAPYGGTKFGYEALSVNQGAGNAISVYVLGYYD